MLDYFVIIRFKWGDSMSTLGIIVEYNPFHNGHLYHLNQAKKITNATTTIGIMSGSFLQRGEPAIVDKWSRAKMAVAQGLDLVIELPTIYSTQAADWFALGATSLLEHLKVDSLVFGSESDSIDILHRIADLLLDEPASFKELLKKELSIGHSYPRALSLAVQNYYNTDFAISKPNDILGIQYLLNLKKMNSSIKAYTIKRLHANYHDQEITENEIASATAVRKTIFSTGNIESINSVVPTTTYNYFLEEWNARRINSWNNYLQSLLLIANSSSSQQLKKIHGMDEGFEQRIKNSLLNSPTYEQLISALKTKRYTATKIQRTLLYLMLGLTKEKVKALNVEQGPTYIRVLGFNDNGRNYLNKIKHELKLPLITNIPRNKPAMLELDITASNMYELGLANPEYLKLEYTQAPFYLK